MSDGRNDSIQSDWTGLLFFVSAVLLSTFILLFLNSSSVSLSYFNLAVPMHGCLGKHSCMSSPIFYSHTEWCVTKGLLLVCLANRTTWTRGFLTLHVSDLLYCQYLAFLVPWLRGSTFSMYDDILTSNSALDNQLYSLYFDKIL